MSVRGREQPDHPSCSRNAHDQNVLVRRAQWKVNQAPSLEGEMSELNRLPIQNHNL